METEMDESSVLEFESGGLEDTGRLGIAIGQSVLAGTVIGLTGTLGSGKTNLTKSIGIGLGLEANDITSPTYTICVPYPHARIPFLHLDSYRIKEDEEVDELALDERVEEGEVIIIEWIERIASVSPPADLLIVLTPTSEETRNIQVTAKTKQGHELLDKIKQCLSS